MSEGGANTEGGNPGVSRLRSFISSKFGGKQESSILSDQKPEEPVQREPKIEVSPSLPEAKDVVHEDVATQLEEETAEAEQVLEGQVSQEERSQPVSELEPIPTPVPEAEKLVRANKIFFHTTPTSNVASIIRRGLYGQATHDAVGRNLTYSLSFEKEYNDKDVRRPSTTSGPITDFSLTVWRQSGDIKQTREMFTGKLNKFGGEYSPAGKTDEQEVPGEYELSGGSMGRPIPTSERPSARRVDPSSFLASIRITEKLAEDLTMIKLSFVNNIFDARTLEIQLGRVLEDSRDSVILGESYTLQDLTHDLVSRTEQEIALYHSKNVADDAMERLRDLDDPNINTNAQGEIVQQELYDIRRKRKAANEPVTYRYLNAREQAIVQMLNQRGLERFNDDPKEEGRLYLAHSSINRYELWGSTDGAALASRVARKMELPF